MITQSKNNLTTGLFGVALGACAMLLWFKTFDSPTEPKIVKVVVPEYHTTETKTEVHHKPVVQADNEYMQYLIDKMQSDIAAYELANDSLKKELYKAAMALNEFEQVFEDDMYKATVSGIAQHRVHSLTLDMFIKPRTIEEQIDVPIPKGLYIGGGLYVPMARDVPLGLGADLQYIYGNTMYRVGANTQRQIVVGASYKF